MDENNSISESEHQTINSEEKMREIINYQSTQMLTLADISNAHSDENLLLKNKLKEITEENEQRKKTEESLRDIFNLQSLLFVLLMLVIYWLFYCSK
jgi:hypothetical protein